MLCVQGGWECVLCGGRLGCRVLCVEGGCVVFEYQRGILMFLVRPRVMWCAGMVTDVLPHHGYQSPHGYQCVLLPRVTC